MNEAKNIITTEDYIKAHQKRVKSWVNFFASILFKRASEHDKSKLKEPEFSLWKKMDEEPRYKYGTPEYNDKLKRFQGVFRMHYAVNRHHYEYFTQKYKNNTTLISLDFDLIDIIEMMCDWLGYKDSISYSEASDLVRTQCKRYGFSEELGQLILNTFRNHFVTFGDFLRKEEKEENGNKINLLI